jgi:predicted exporter
MAVLASLALPFIHWQDDIRNLQYPLPHLDAVDAEIRNLHGGEREVLLTVGDDYASSRDSLEQLLEWLQQKGAEPSDFLSAAAWVPTIEEASQADYFIEAHPDFAEQVLRQLEEGAYDREAFDSFEEAWSGMATGSYEHLVAGFSEVLAGGLSGIVGSNEDLHWWVTLLDVSIDLGEIPPGFNSLRLSEIESMSSVLSSYRERTLELSLLGGAMIYVVLLLAFGFKDGSRILFVPLVAVVCAVCVIDYFFGALGLFHLIGLFLGTCLVLDYAVFSWMGFVRSRQIPFSVIVSALTTAASFGILCWSRIPAIHALGLAVFCVTLMGALCTYLFIPSIATPEDIEDAS